MPLLEQLNVVGGWGLTVSPFFFLRRREGGEGGKGREHITQASLTALFGITIPR